MSAFLDQELIPYSYSPCCFFLFFFLSGRRRSSKKA